jgi:DNA polymerase-3 subunit alpha
VPAGYFQEFQNKNPRDCSYRVKAYQFKGLLMPFVQFGKNKRLRFLKQSFQKIKKYWLIQTLHLHNHTILRFTIDNKYSKLVKAASKEKMPAVAMTDHAELMGVLTLFVISHNKAAEAKMQH